MSVLDQTTAPPGTTPGRTARRPEVDGLRALAVTLVVGYHVFSGRVSGGVDVFLVLTGFFLVLTLSGQFRRDGRVRPLATISRTVTRLLPTALLVLAVTAVAAAVVMPPTRWREVATHLVSAVTFTENHRLVQEAVDYSASNATASPVQHFWSLSIQVQVLLVVPLVVAAGAFLLRRAGGGHLGRPVAVAAVAAVTAASFAWSVISTRADQQVAYFSTLPRLWELGVGALVALLLAAVRPGPRTALVLGWGGVLALIACGAVLDGAHLFPGWAAAWPVACAVAVLLAGGGGGRAGVHRLLSRPFAAWLGQRSYALYLWHWPVLVLYLVHADRDAPTPGGAAAVIVASVVLADLTHRVVELPATTRLRAWRPGLALAVVTACTLPLLTAGVGFTAWLDRQAGQLAQLAEHPSYPGALALRGAVPATGGLTGVEPLPSLTVIRDDWPTLDGARCTTEQFAADPVPAETDVCVLGPDDAERRIVVVGDSHAAQWLPPLAALATDRSWQLHSIVRGGCNLSTESEFIQEGWPGYEECAAWRSHLVDRIRSLEPDLVVTLGTRTGYGPEEEYLPAGFVAAWEQLAEAGITVLAMRDTPRHVEDVPDCTARWGDTATQCELARSAAYTEGLLETAAPELPPGVHLVDTSDWFCTDTTCPPLVGNVRVHLDGGHVTATYMRSIAPLLEERLRTTIGW
ncbi:MULTISPECIES: acyltransferase family protein [unclassified Modestobacter]